MTDFRSEFFPDAGSSRDIALDRVRPGDVLLLGGTSATSSAIKLATGGPYSHAAIFITNSILFEAVGGGLGFAAMKINDVLQHGTNIEVTGSYPPISLIPEFRLSSETQWGKIKQLASDTWSNILHTPFKTEEKTKFKILRHKGVKNCSPDSVTRQLLEAVVSNWGMRYPEFAKLLRALPAFQQLPAGNRKEAKHNTRSGNYCSQLVLTLLESIDHGQLASQVPGNDISPSALAKLDDFEEIDCVPQFKGIEDDRCNDLHIDFLTSNENILNRNQGRVTLAWLFDKFHTVDSASIVETSLHQTIDRASAPPDERLNDKQAVEISFGWYVVAIISCSVNDWQVWRKIIADYKAENPFQELSDILLEKTGVRLI